MLRTSERWLGGVSDRDGIWSWRKCIGDKEAKQSYIRGQGKTVRQPIDRTYLQR